MKKSINIGKLLVLPYNSYSNYINLPPSSLDRLSKLNTNNTYFFEIKISTDIVSYVGVKEFISDESCIEVPSWLAESLGADYVNITLIKNIPKGEFIKIEPLSEDFFELPDNDKLVEIELAKYCLLELNQIIPMKIFDKVYKFKIVDIKDNDVIDITNIDLNVDFINKFLKEETKSKNIIPEKKETNLDFSNMLYENKNLDGSIDNILGGKNVDTNKVREARLKYYENKFKKIDIVETKLEEIIETKPEIVSETKPEEIIETKPEEIIEPETITPGVIQVVKPKRKYVRKNKVIT